MGHVADVYIQCIFCIFSLCLDAVYCIFSICTENKLNWTEHRGCYIPDNVKRGRFVDII